MRENKDLFFIAQKKRIATAIRLIYLSDLMIRTILPVHLPGLLHLDPDLHLQTIIPH